MKFSPLGKAVCSQCRQENDKTLLIHIPGQLSAVLVSLCVECLERMTMACHNQDQADVDTIVWMTPEQVARVAAGRLKGDPDWIDGGRYLWERPPGSAPGTRFFEEWGR